MPIRLACLVLTLALVPRPAPGQVAPLTVPRGALRLDFSGRFESFDRRWHDGAREEWAGAFDGRVLDRTAVPGLLSAEQRLAQLTGLPAVSLTVGETRATQLLNVGTMGIGAAWGVTSWLTVFGTVPFVRVAARTSVSLDGTDASAGPNPADPVVGTAAGRGQAATFFASLAQASTTLQARIAAGDYDADPARKALAQQTLSRANGLAAALFDLLTRPGTAASFLPRAGTPAATALVQTVQQLQGTFADDLGVGGFSALPPLPAGAATTADLLAFMTSPDGPVAARPFDDVPDLTYIGDIEVGGVVALVDRFPASANGRGLRAALETTVRLRTARLDRPDRFLDLGTGDRQPDVEVALVSDVGLGRFGARLSAGYNLQLPGNQNRRVAPEGTLAPAAALAAVRRDPGDVVRAGVQPFFRMTPFLALSGSAEYWRRGGDGYEYVAGQPPVEGVDVAVLAAGSRADALVLGGALTFMHSGRDRHGAVRLPLDAAVRYTRVARSTMGLVADAHTLQVDLRLYARFLR
jgi:hypothetical protein